MGILGFHSAALRSRAKQVLIPGFRSQEHLAAQQQSLYVQMKVFTVPVPGIVLQFFFAQKRRAHDGLQKSGGADSGIVDRTRLSAKKSAPRSSASRSMRPSRTGANVSSASRSAIHSPRALSRPVFLAAPGPPFVASRINLKRSSPCAAAIATSAVSSLDASSITISSISRRVWPSADRIASGIYSLALCAGMMIDTFGVTLTSQERESSFPWMINYFGPVSDRDSAGTPGWLPPPLA